MALGSGFLLECFRERFLSHWEALVGTEDQCIEVVLSTAALWPPPPKSPALFICSGYSGHPLMPYDVQSSKHKSRTDPCEPDLPRSSVQSLYSY